MMTKQAQRTHRLAEQHKGKLSSRRQQQAGPQGLHQGQPKCLQGREDKKAGRLVSRAMPGQGQMPAAGKGGQEGGGLSMRLSRGLSASVIVILTNPSTSPVGSVDFKCLYCSNCGPNSATLDVSSREGLATEAPGTSAAAPCLPGQSASHHTQTSNDAPTLTSKVS